MASKTKAHTQHCLSTDDLQEVLDAVYSISPHKVINFGLKLGVTHNRIEAFRMKYNGDMEHCLREILNERLKQEPPLTWHDIVGALRAPSVKEDQLARQIECHYMTHSPSSDPLHETTELTSGTPAAKRCRVESTTQSDTCSVAVDRQPTNAMARMIEEVINRHTTKLSIVIGDNVTYFANAFVSLGIITRHSAKEIRSMCEIGDSEKGSRLLDTVTTNIGGSHDRFEKFVSVFSSESAYQDLATSMTEDFRTRCKHNRCTGPSAAKTHPAVDPHTTKRLPFSTELVGGQVMPHCGALSQIATSSRSSSNQPPTQQCINYVKTFYKGYQVEKDPKVVKLLKTPTKIYINLMCIDRQSVRSTREYDEVTKAMVQRGDVDVIHAKKWPIDINLIATNMPDSSLEKVILVEGAPGVGKSTFAWEFCRRWERREIARQYQLVLLLRLRDERISKAMCLKDLIYHPSEAVCRAVTMELESTLGRNTLLILEGFDELPDTLRTMSSVFLGLIHGQLLPLATVMVTSRPWATYIILDTCSHRIFQHIEILGFTNEQIASYIGSVLSDSEARGLEAYTKKHPQIRSCMYIPLNSAIVVTVYQERQKKECALPTTLTELYTALTQVLMRRHMRGHPEYGAAIKCIDTLALSVPPKVHDNFFKLCKLAYSGIVGTSDQVQLIFRDLPSDFDDLGLMDSVTELYVTQGAVSSYNFLHLTFQEFFAAMHISTMSEEEQLKHFYRHEEGRLKMVLRFLAGLKKLSCFSLTDNHSCEAPSTRHEDDSNSSWLLAGLSCFSNKRHIDNHFFQTPSIIEHEDYLMSCDVAVNIDLVHWMFEAQSEEITLGHGTVEFYNYSLLPLDCYALGYCIVRSQCQWVLGIRWGEEKMRMLVAGASTKQETTAKVVGLHLLVNEISTECLNTLFTEWKSLFHLHELSLRLPEQCDSITWPDLSTLRVLDIEFNYGTKWRLDTLLSHLSLDSLTVHIRIYSDLVCDAIGDYIKSASCHLKELLIISEDPAGLWFDITAALANNHSLPLETLELKCECKFTDTAAEDLAQFITNTTTLSYLTIEHCTISVRGVLVLDRAIQQNSITMNLEDLTIEVYGDDEAEDLKQLLIEYPDMAVSIFCIESGDAGAGALAQALHHNSTLEWLYLSDNSISDDGAVALAQALHHNSTLEWLDLSNNSISEAGAGALAQALHHNSTLEWLDLSNNSISEAGAGALAQALHHNSTLMELDLFGNDGIGGESTHQLVQVLTVKKSICVKLPRRCEEYATQCAQYQTVKNRFKFTDKYIL